MSYPQGPQGPQWHPQQQYPQQYPPQQYPQQQYPQQGYPPPKKGNGLLIGLIAGGGALVVVVFVILAFVAPGFLLSDSKSSSSATQTPLQLDWGPVLAGKFMLAVFGDEPDKAAESACADAKDKVRQAAKEYGDRNASLRAKDPRAVSPDLILVTTTGTLDHSEPYNGNMEVRREAGDKYCISAVSPLPAG
ncbi:hypothetical protein ACIA2T_24065 [Amycolatopsis japonica]|uniref:hypothetical protein n=1 Tax=Amycolatopsis japonica TaxID=208439 RepID=UPI0037B67ABD